MTDVAAVVLAAMGGARLERSLASVAWLEERVVLDPAARLAAHAVPPDVRHVARPAPLRDLSRATWLLLLLEGETAAPPLAEALARLLGDAPPAPCGLTVEMRALGMRWTPRRAPVRLAPRATAELTVRDGQPELARAGVPLATSAPAIVAAPPPSLEHAVRALDAESAALAAWLHPRGGRVGVRHLLVPPLGAAARVLAARGAAERPWARWVAAVFAGYRTLLVPAKVWERRQLAAVEAPAMPAGA